MTDRHAVATNAAPVLRLVLIAALPLVASPTAAWDYTGHRVVARIAWDAMSPAARTAAAELLLEAPEDADLRQLLPEDGRPLAERRREHFELAAYWPDMVRHGDFPERRERYSRGQWHYTNFFWEQGSDGEPRERTDLQPAAVNVVERLEALDAALADPEVPAEDRAIYLAWILHLVGDVHQPLHTAARVTASEPEGDRGGNLFELADDRNLHSWWDGVIRRGHFRWFFWSDDAYVERIARAITERYPRSDFTAGIEPGAYESWAREGFETATERLYPPELERGREPPAAYERMALEIAERRVAQAGYRLADLLERRLGEEAAPQPVGGD